MKKCPFCAEEVQDDALYCKHCKHDLTAPNISKSGMSKDKISKPWYKKWWAIAIFIIIGINILASLVSNTAKNAPQSPAQDNVKVELTPEQLEQDKKTVKEYYEKALAQGKIGDDAVNAVMAKLQAGNIFNSYSEVTSAIDTLGVVSTNLGALERQFTLNDKAQETIFDDGLSDLATAYYSKSGAMKKVQDFLNDNKPKYIEDAKYKLSLAQNNVLSGLAKLMEIVVNYGLLDEVMK